MQVLAEHATRLLGSLTGRPYVFVLFALYLVLATLQLGLVRVAWMTLLGYAVAWASELASIHVGFPYGRYAYLEQELANDLLVLGVPFFDSLSYTFLAYFSWATATLLRARTRRPGLDLSGTTDTRRSVGVLALAAFLMTWADVVVDPIATLGDRWFLGKVHAYERAGSYFGVPLSNFVGWLLVSTAIVAVYQAVDRACDRRRAPWRRRLRGQALFAPAAYAAVVLFAVTMSFAIGEVGLALASCFVQLPIFVWIVARVADG